MQGHYCLGLAILSFLLLAHPPTSRAQPELLASYDAESGLEGWEGHAIFLEEDNVAAGAQSFGLGQRVGSFEYHYWSALSPLLDIPDEARTGGFAVHLRCRTDLSRVRDMSAWLAIYRFNALDDPIDMGTFVTLDPNAEWTLFSVDPLLLPPEVTTIRIEFNMGDPLLEKIPGIHHFMLFDEVEIYLLKMFDVPVAHSSVGVWKSKYSR